MAVANREFERAHPRGPGGLFIEVLGAVEALGGSWDEPNQRWLVPSKHRDSLNEVLEDSGFRVVNLPEGMRPAEPPDRAKFKYPPAWTDVFVSDDPDLSGQVLVKGVDAAGRSQSTYSDVHHLAQAKEKFARIRGLDRHYPALRERMASEGQDDPTAAALLVSAAMGLRPGSTRDTKAVKQAYGASTLQRRHVSVEGDTVRLKFPAKKGTLPDLKLTDPDLARVLRRHMRGKAKDERLFKTSDNKMNQWLDEAAPGFTSKDLRTRLGTATARDLVQNSPVPRNEKEYRHLRNQVGDEVARILGNTRSEALKSYIDPTVFRDWDGVAPANIKPDDETELKAEILRARRGSPRHVDKPKPKDLTEPEKGKFSQAVDMWQYNFSEVNKGLRTGQAPNARTGITLTPASEPIVNRFDAKLAHRKSTEPKELRRGVNMDPALFEGGVGSVFVDRGYQSWTDNDDLAADFAQGITAQGRDPVVLSTTLPPGTSVLPLHEDVEYNRGSLKIYDPEGEGIDTGLSNAPVREFLVDRDSYWRIAWVETIDGVRHVRLELVHVD